MIKLATEIEARANMVLKIDTRNFCHTDVSLYRQLKQLFSHTDDRWLSNI